MQKLFWANDLCDVELICGQNTLHAHRAVLAAQSEVLRGLVRETSVLRLSEISHVGAVQIMLEFLYDIGDGASYTPPSMDANMDVLRLATRFRLTELKRRAAVYMARRITSHNAVECLLSCEVFDLQDLRA